MPEVVKYPIFIIPPEDMEIRKYHGMMPTPMTPHAEATTLEVTMPDILPD